jgi:predicted RND superfamily exporter protein
MMVPFLLFGVGLDDAYILFGSYVRLDPKMDIGERIKATFDDVGVGIFLTSLTSVVAFILGSFSAIPAVKWLCLYAFPAVAIDFFYQITFFVALMVLDEKRIQANRMDWCTCIIVQSRDRYATQDSAIADGAIASDGTRARDGPHRGGRGELSDSILRNDVDCEGVDPDAEQKADKDDGGDRSPESLESHSWVDRLMAWWAIQLLKPWVQTVVMTAFVGLAIGSIYCATQLDQDFDFTDMVPKDSFLKTYYTSLDTYSDRSSLIIQAYFRFVDQGDPEIQEQMNTFITELVASGEVYQPVYFWLWDFQNYSTQRAMNATDIFPLTSFEEQIDEFLMEETYHNLYDEDIGRSYRRNVTETRCHLHADVDVQDSKATVLMMNKLREVAASQPINQGEDSWRFFAYAGDFHIFEFYNQVINELVFNTVTGIIAVTVIALMFIPHWTAAPFVFAFICLLYANLLGFLYLSGVQINVRLGM